MRRAFCLIILLCIALSAHAGVPKNILAIHSYHGEYPWTNIQHHGYVDTLFATIGKEHNIFIEFMNSKTNTPSEEYFSMFEDTLTRKYRNTKIDLIYVTDDPALLFVMRSTSPLLSAPPVVFSGVSESSSVNSLNRERFTGILELKDITKNLNLAFRLYADAGGVILLGDGSDSDTQIFNDLRLYFAEDFPAKKLLRVETNNLNNAVRQLSALPRYPVIITTIGGIRTDDGNISPLDETMEELAKAAPGRILVTEDPYLTQGAIGGFVVSGAESGKIAAQQSVRILKGEHTADIPLLAGEAQQYLFDDTAVTNSHLSIPPDIGSQALFINKIPGFFERHTVEILTTIFIVISTLLVITFAAMLNAHRKNRVITRQSHQLNSRMKLLKEYQRAVDVSNIVSKTDLNGVITYVNDAFCDISGLSRDEMLGKPHNIVRHPDMPKETFRDLWDTIQEGNVWKGLVKNRRADGSAYYVDATIVPIKDENDNVTEYISIRKDITTIIEQQETIRSQATDTLTGLPNRVRLMKDVLETEDRKLALVNIDAFREINDFYGLEVGDVILKLFAQKLVELVPQNIRAYRVMGDEFALLAGSDMNYTAFGDVLKHINTSFFESGLTFEENIINLSLTIGYTDDPENTFVKADMALNRAKEEKIHLAQFDSSYQQVEVFRKNIEYSEKVRVALRAGRIVPFFQPIVDNTTQEIVKYEALVRLIEEDGKVLSPFFFLDIAKKSKLYDLVSRQVIERSIRVAAEKGVHLSVNLTVDDILSSETLSMIYRLLTETGVGHLITFEITESEGIENFKEISMFIEEIRELGCKIAIDDFGTGYSNFNYLMELNPDFIKIDGSIIKNILTDRKALVVTELLVNFAKRGGMKVIAEFVSSQELYEAVKDLGIDCSQGYHFGAPEPELRG